MLSIRDITITWSYLVWQELWRIRVERWMTQKELSKKIWVPQSFISRVLARQEKWNEILFHEIWKALGIPEKKVEELLLQKLYEAIENRDKNT